MEFPHMVSNPVTSVAGMEWAGLCVCTFHRSGTQRLSSEATLENVTTFCV